MKQSFRILPIFLPLALLHLTAHAERPSTNAQTGSGKTQVYEPESTERTVTVTVKNLRETDEGWLVFFEKPQGGFSFHDEAIHDTLAEAMKSGKPVVVKIDDEAKNVKKASSSKADQNPRGK
jgi:hypothetical protein